MQYEGVSIWGYCTRQTLTIHAVSNANFRTLMWREVSNFTVFHSLFISIAVHTGITNFVRANNWNVTCSENTLNSPQERSGLLTSQAINWRFLTPAHHSRPFVSPATVPTDHRALSVVHCSARLTVVSHDILVLVQVRRVCLNTIIAATVRTTCIRTQLCS